MVCNNTSLLVCLSRANVFELNVYVSLPLFNLVISKVFRCVIYSGKCCVMLKCPCNVILFNKVYDSGSPMTPDTLLSDLELV